MTVKEKIEWKFDPTDADKASELSETCGRVLVHASHALWSEEHGMRMGRDTARELRVSCSDMAVSLGILPFQASGKEHDDLWNGLYGQTGLPPCENPIKTLASAIKKFCPEAAEMITNKLAEQGKAYDEFVAFLQANP